MARPKSITTEELLRLLDEYILDNAGVKITLPNFGVYIRNKKYIVQDHTLRRNADLRAKIDAFNKGIEKQADNDIVVYKTLDVEAFMRKNSNREKLKDALSELDRYYAGISAKAADAIVRRKKSEQELERMKQELADLEAKVVGMQARADSDAIRQKDDTIRTLNRILRSYVYPAVADTLLSKDGILEVVESIIAEEKLEENIIMADTDMASEDITENKFSEFASLNSLLGGFDES